MNYQKIYNELIFRAQNESRSKGQGIYYENHHILPKGVGGNNKKENLVLLTAKEHYIAHLLLIQLYTGKERAKLTFGLFQMCRKNQQHKRIVSSRDFEKVKKLMSENCSGEYSSFYGKTHTEETKKLLSEKMKGDKNPSIKYGVWNKGLKTGELSEEHKNKIRNGVKGFQHTDIAKEKISKVHKGKLKSEEHKVKISNSLKGQKRDTDAIKRGADKLRNRKQPILICPHCGKQGGTTMYRWHFDNCNEKN